MIDKETWLLRASAWPYPTTRMIAEGRGWTLEEVEERGNALVAERLVCKLRDVETNEEVPAHLSIADNVWYVLSHWEVGRTELQDECLFVDALKKHRYTPASAVGLYTQMPMEWVLRVGRRLQIAGRVGGMENKFGAVYFLPQPGEKA